MRNIIITGGANGVGRAVANRLKKENLILVDIDKQNLERTAKQLSCNYFCCDLTEVDEVKKLTDFVLKNFKKVDCLINCAGLWTKGELSQLKDGHFAKINELNRVKKIIDTNVFSSMAMIMEFAPIFISQKYGQIVNINSQSGVVVEEFCPVYNASKQGAAAYRKAIQADLARNNVKITDVCPGLIKTDFYVRAGDKLPDEIMSLGLEPDDVAGVVEYIVNLPSEITIPSIEIKNIKNY